MVRVIVGRARTPQTMTVTTDDGRRYSLYSSPSQFSFGEVARFGSIDREGLRPITRRTGAGLKTLSFTHRIASLDYTRSIEHAIAPLTRLGKSGRRVRFVGGSNEYEQGVWWFIKDLSLEVEQRAADNRVSRATLAWSLEEAVDVSMGLARNVPRRGTAAPARTPGREHRVMFGHTLYGIAARYLGDGARWPEIYAMNRARIGNPNALRAGTVLRIPA